MATSQQSPSDLSRRRLLQHAGAAAGLAAFGSFLYAAPITNPLNVLLITADDLGPQLGCYGDMTVPTPNLDRLAAEGCRFSRGYVTQPSCSPSRSSILTGLYPHQNGQIGLANKGFPYTMHADVATLPAMLRKADYRTGIIGKLHVNPEEAFPFDFARKEAPPTRQVRQVAEQAEEFLADHAGKPFFLFVNYFDPHIKFVDQVDGLPTDPIEPAKVRPWPWQQIETQEQRQRIASYYNCIARMDAGIGLLMKKLSAAGHTDDTLVIFMGDNGPPFARAKTTCYEAGVRVPILVRWPRAKAGLVSNALVSGLDVVPTILAAAGMAENHGLPGRSWLPILNAQPIDWRQTLFTEHTSHRPQDFFPRRSILDARYKLILNLTPQRGNPTVDTDNDPAFQISRDPALDGTVARRAFDTLAHPPADELYDLHEDPHELNNLAGQPAYRKIQNALHQQLLAWRKETQDPLLDPAALDALSRLHDSYQP